MAIWIRPSGSEIETNDEKATIEFAEANDWKLKKNAKPKKKSNSVKKK